MCLVIFKRDVTSVFRVIVIVDGVGISNFVSFFLMGFIMCNCERRGVTMCEVLY